MPWYSNMNLVGPHEDIGSVKKGDSTGIYLRMNLVGEGGDIELVKRYINNGIGAVDGVDRVIGKPEYANAELDDKGRLAETGELYIGFKPARAEIGVRVKNIDVLDAIRKDAEENGVEANMDGFFPSRTSYNKDMRARKKGHNQ